MASDISLSRSELRGHGQMIKLHALFRKDFAAEILRGGGRGSMPDRASGRQGSPSVGRPQASRRASSRQVNRRIPGTYRLICGLPCRGAGVGPRYQHSLWGCPVRLPIAASLGAVGEATRLAPKRRCSKSAHMFHSVPLPDTATDGVFFENCIDTHSDGARAVEYVGGHERPVLGKRGRQLAAPPVRQT
jgi:hypothetical protein